MFQTSNKIKMSIKKKSKIKFSLIIPCYNESRNIDYLLKRSKSLLKLSNFEMILVNNGSTDDIDLKFNKLRKIKNLSFIKINKNIGFGHGVMMGLKKAKGEIIGYTHADHQTDPLDFYKIIKTNNFNKNDKIFIKGYRNNKLINNWSFLDCFLTFAQSIFQSIFLVTRMYDIHSQPNIFSRSLINIKKDYPSDFMIDTYFYYLAKNNHYKINRFNVTFNKKHRGYGVGNNDTLYKNIKGIFKHIFGTFLLIKILNF